MGQSESLPVTRTVVTFEEQQALVATKERPFCLLEYFILNADDQPLHWTLCEVYQLITSMYSCAKYFDRDLLLCCNAGILNGTPAPASTLLGRGISIRTLQYELDVVPVDVESAFSAEEHLTEAGQRHVAIQQSEHEKNRQTRFRSLQASLEQSGAQLSVFGGSAISLQEVSKLECTVQLEGYMYQHCQDKVLLANAWFVEFLCSGNPALLIPAFEKQLLISHRKSILDITHNLMLCTHTHHTGKQQKQTNAARVRMQLNREMCMTIGHCDWCLTGKSDKPDETVLGYDAMFVLLLVALSFCDVNRTQSGNTVIVQECELKQAKKKSTVDDIEDALIAPIEFDTQEFLKVQSGSIAPPAYSKDNDAITTKTLTPTKTTTITSNTNTATSSSPVLQLSSNSNARALLQEKIKDIQYGNDRNWQQEKKKQHAKLKASKKKEDDASMFSNKYLKRSTHRGQKSTDGIELTSVQQQLDGEVISSRNINSDSDDFMDYSSSSDEGEIMIKKKVFTKEELESSSSSENELFSQDEIDVDIDYSTDDYTTDSDSEEDAEKKSYQRAVENIEQRNRKLNLAMPAATAPDEEWEAYYAQCRRVAASELRSFQQSLKPDAPAAVEEPEVDAKEYLRRAAQLVKGVKAPVKQSVSTASPHSQWKVARQDGIATFIAHSSVQMHPLAMLLAALQRYSCQSSDLVLEAHVLLPLTDCTVTAVLLDTVSNTPSNIQQPEGAALIPDAETDFILHTQMTHVDCVLVNSSDLPSSFAIPTQPIQSSNNHRSNGRVPVHAVNMQHYQMFHTPTPQLITPTHQSLSTGQATGGVRKVKKARVLVQVPSTAKAIRQQLYTALIAHLASNKGTSKHDLISAIHYILQFGCPTDLQCLITVTSKRSVICAKVVPIT